MPSARRNRPATEALFHVKPWLSISGALLLLAGAAAQPARAQGVVLDKDSRPLAVKRARALLVFQELGGFSRPEARAEDNPEELLVEIELCEVAPAGAVWRLAAPRGARGRPASAAVLDELSAYWRAGAAQAGEPEAWPTPCAVELGPEGDLEFLKTLELRFDGPTWKLLAEQAAANWRFHGGPVPQGARALLARISFRSACALYPGALGATGAGSAQRPAWELPPTEIMVLHSHFINVDDNTGGLALRLGLRRAWQDGESLSDARAWAHPEKARAGRLRDAAAAGRLAATVGLMQELAPDAHFLLTVVGGAPRAAERRALDFTIYSHYPTAVEPLPVGRSLLWLGGLLLLVVLLGAFLLKRKGFAS